MKSTRLAAFWLPAAQGASFVANRGKNPVADVVTLLTDLQTQIHTDTATEQEEYDKFACWCEDTLGQKANAISDAKKHIEETQQLVVKLNGEVGVHGAEIAQIEQDLRKNVKSSEEAEAVRDGQLQKYEDQKLQAEQCIGALESAITVLGSAPPSAGDGSFLKTRSEAHHAQLLSVAASVRSVLSSVRDSHRFTDDDLKVVHQFVNNPQEFFQREALSAAQVSKRSPFGDYAPQSGQIGGILKQMYEGFTLDLERANVQEAKQRKAFKELMATKLMERNTLQATAQSTEGVNADKKLLLADSKLDLDLTKEQLTNDETFFQTTKEQCSTKAQMWSSRTRLRTEELHGIAQALSILGSEEAQALFDNATTTFLQISARPNRTSKNQTIQNGTKAAKHLSALAAKYQSVEIAHVAVMARTGGHFDSVITSIDAMVRRLRNEQEQDIKERDWCVAAQDANTISIEDVEHDIEKANESLTRLEGEIADLAVGALKDEMNTTQQEVDELKALRAAERESFFKAIQDDADAIDLIAQAMATLGRYMALAQTSRTGTKKAAQEPPPSTSFGSGDAAGHEGQTTSIINILSLIKADLEKEVEVAREEDQQAQVQFDADLGGLTKILETLAKQIIAMETEAAYKERIHMHTTNKRDQKMMDLVSENEVKTSLAEKCAWVETDFDSRRTKRSAEIEGLIEARNFLSG